jgi:multicomponent Na+:H+ antiporter subunit C
MSFAPYAVAIWIFLVGLYGVVTSHHLMHLVICLSVVQSSTYLLLLGIGYRTDGAASIFVDIPPNTKAVDPVVKALTLTDVVVGAAVTALLLALTVQAKKRFGTLDPDELDPLRD